MSDTLEESANELSNIIYDLKWEDRLRYNTDPNPIDIAASEARIAILTEEEKAIEAERFALIEEAKASLTAQEAQVLTDLLESASLGELKPTGGCCGGSTGFFNNATNPAACEFGKPRKSWLQANYSCGTQAGDGIPGANYPSDVSNTVRVVKEQNIR